MMNMPINLPVSVQKPVQKSGNTSANSKESSSSFGNVLATTQQINENIETDVAATGNADAGPLEDGAIPDSVLAMLQAMMPVLPQAESTVQETVSETGVAAVGQATETSPSNLMKTAIDAVAVNKAHSSVQQAQGEVSETTASGIGGQTGQPNAQTEPKSQAQTQAATVLSGIETTKQVTDQQQVPGNVVTNPNISLDVTGQSGQNDAQPETPLSQVSNTPVTTNPVVAASAGSTGNAENKKLTVNTNSMSSPEQEDAQKDANPVQIMTVQNSDSTEKKDFSGSAFLNDMTQKQTSIPVSQSVGDNNVIVPFQAQLENKLSTPAETVSVSQNAMPTTQDKYDVASQIVENARTIFRSNNTEMVIKLKPEHLGELTFKVAVENGTVRASFVSNNPEVRGAIEASLPQLKQDLANQGIKLDNVGVFAGMEQFLSGDQRGEQQYQQQFTAGRKSYDDAAETVQEISALNSLENAADGGVDYKV